MTKEEILAMEAGRELDAKVSIEIFSTDVYWFDGEAYRLGGEWEFSRPIEYIPRYSTDISAAWLVMEKLKENWDCITLLWDFGAWDMLLERGAKKFYLGKESGATYEQLPEAICKAALLTKLDEIERLEDEAKD